MSQKKRRRVLLLDGDPFFLTETAELLQSRSYLVRTLLSPERLLFFLPRFQPNILLLDFDAVETTGMELLQSIRGSSFGKNLPVVLFTSRKESVILEKAVKGGIDDFVRKPLVLDEFFWRLDAILRRSLPGRLFVRLENWEPKQIAAKGLLFWRQGYASGNLGASQAKQCIERLSLRWLHSFRDHLLSREERLQISDLPIVALHSELLFLPLPFSHPELHWIAFLEKQARILRRYWRQIQKGLLVCPKGEEDLTCEFFLRWVSSNQEIHPDHFARSIQIALQLEAASDKPFAVLKI